MNYSSSSSTRYHGLLYLPVVCCRDSLAERTNFSWDLALKRTLQKMLQNYQRKKSALWLERYGAQLSGWIPKQCENLICVLYT